MQTGGGRGGTRGDGGDPWLAAEAERVLGAQPDSIERLTHSRVTRGVWRVSARGGTAISKVLARPPAGDPDHDPASMRYWLREAIVYDGGVPAPYLKSGVRGPRLLARFDRPDGDVALWLEDLGAASAASWALSQFEAAAERLGRAQGAYLTGTPLPDDAWLCRDYLRQYHATVDRRVDFGRLDDPAAWRQPAIARTFGPELADGLRRLHADRERFVRLLERLPRTVAHLDVWPANLFAEPDGLVIIDWGFAGFGAAGEDMGNLVPDCVFDMLHPPSILAPLDSALFEGYRRGLRRAGWTGDPRLVRLAMDASAVKYDWIAPATLARAGDERQTIYGGGEVDGDRFFAVRAAVLRHLVAAADEARRLASELGFG